MQHLRQFTFFTVLALIAGCTTLSNSAQPHLLQPTTVTTITPSTVLQASSAAVNAARLRLTRNGLENPALVSVVHITPTTWSDDCLGLPSDKPCQTKAVAGYLVELERDGQRYLFRTDQDGKRARLAWSPAQPLSDAFVQWRYSDDQGCHIAIIGTEQIQFGACGEALLAAPLRTPMWPDIKGQSQASYLKQAYAPFTANTLHGTLIFTGTGTVAASEVEQRAITEWAFTRFEEANANYLSADYGLTLFWHEETLSSCGGLWVYQTGLAVAWNCAGTEALGVGFLSAAQLQQFYTWLDSGKRWDINRTGQVEGKPTQVILQFSSSRDIGENALTQDAENVLQFAREVYTGLTDRVSKK